jgi:hypothetical protein
VTPGAPERAIDDWTPEAVLAYFAERFGIPAAAFEPYQVMIFGQAAWLASKAMPSLAGLAAWEGQNPGVRLLRDLRTHVKPTSAGLRIVGASATRNVAELRADEVWPFLAREPVRRPLPVLSGFAVVRLADSGPVLGCGLMTGDGLVSQVPDTQTGDVKTSLYLAPRAEPA